jgi:predicted DNA-binding antitoxin AbrB/MazE fold protein
MITVPAIYENGVFRPLKKVDLPEATRVDIPLPTAERPPMPAGLAAIHEVLSRRYDGDSEDAARVDPARK